MAKWVTFYYSILDGLKDIFEKQFFKLEKERKNYD